MRSWAVLHARGSWVFILPEVLRILFKTSHTIFYMFAKGYRAPSPADGCPIHMERSVVVPSSGQLCACALV